MDLKLPADLDADLDGIKLTTPVFMIDLYSDKPLSTLGPGVLATFERYRQIVGDEALRFYATGTMRKHAKVTKRALTMLETWLEPGAKLSDMVAIEFHDGADYNHAPTSTAFAIHGREETKHGRVPDASHVRLSLPVSWGTETPEKALALTEELWALLPWRSGQAGFAFETTRYLPKDAHEHAYAQSMRHPGIDIAYTVNDAIIAGLEHLRRVGWLTLIDDAFVAQLGGLDELRKAVGPEVKVVKLGHGVLLQAGDRPQIGDVNRQDNLPAYRAVYRAVKPLLMDPTDAPALHLHGDYVGRSEAWLSRFEK